MSIDDSSNIHEISQTSALGTSSPYEIDGNRARPLSGFDSSNITYESIGSNFIGNNNMFLIAGVHSISLDIHLHHLAWLWRTFQYLQSQWTDIIKTCMDDHKKVSAAGCDGTSSQPKLDNGMFLIRTWTLLMWLFSLMWMTKTIEIGLVLALAPFYRVLLVAHITT